MADLPDLSSMLDAERKRLKRKPKTAEQRDRDWIGRTWWRNICDVWTDARLLSDEELLWLAAVTDATREKPARVLRSGWTGKRTIARQPTNADDAARLEDLRRSLWDHDEERRRRREARQQLAERLAHLGLYAANYADLDRWADIRSPLR